jgi:hypothetical protein
LFFFLLHSLECSRAELLLGEQMGGSTAFQSGVKIMYKLFRTFLGQLCQGKLTRRLKEPDLTQIHTCKVYITIGTKILTTKGQII